MTDTTDDIAARLAGLVSGRGRITRGRRFRRGHAVAGRWTDRPSALSD